MKNAIKYENAAKYKMQLNYENTAKYKNIFKYENTAKIHLIQTQPKINLNYTTAIIKVHIETHRKTYRK